MPELWTVRLRFEGRAQLESDAGRGLLPSDRLYSVLCWGLHACWGDGAVQEFTTACLRGAPPWTVSSAFPFLADLDFMPKPRAPLPEQWAEHARALKSSPWVPLPVFRRWMTGQSGQDPDSENLDRMLGEAPRRLRASIVEDVQANVAIDRLGTNSSLYHTTAVRFSKGTGLYFFLRLGDEAWGDFMRGALRVLEDAGIGGRRAAGFGHFRAEICTATPGVEGWGPVPSGSWCLISRLSPEPTRVRDLLADATFSLEEVGGWVLDGQVRRRRIRLLTEGSVFRRWDPGRWVSVQPPQWEDHPVYRGGLSFGVPVADGVVT